MRLARLVSGWVALALFLVSVIGLAWRSTSAEESKDEKKSSSVFNSFIKALKGDSKKAGYKRGNLLARIILVWRTTTGEGQMVPQR